MNEKIEEFSKLSPEDKEFIVGINKSLAKEPTQEEKEKQQQEKQLREQNRIEHEKHFEELKKKCDTMTSDDFRNELSKIFSCLEQYQLRYFYIFITEKLRINVSKERYF